MTDTSTSPTHTVSDQELKRKLGKIDVHMDALEQQRAEILAELKKRNSVEVGAEASNDE